MLLAGYILFIQVNLVFFDERERALMEVSCINIVRLVHAKSRNADVSTRWIEYEVESRSVVINVQAKCKSH